MSDKKIVPKYTDYLIIFGYDYNEDHKFSKLVNTYLAKGYTLFNSHIPSTHFIELYLLNPEYKEPTIPKQVAYVQVKGDLVLEKDKLQKQVMSYIDKGYHLFKSHIEGIKLCVELVLVH